MMQRRVSTDELLELIEVIRKLAERGKQQSFVFAACEAADKLFTDAAKEAALHEAIERRRTAPLPAPGNEPLIGLPPGTQFFSSPTSNDPPEGAGST